MDKHFLFDEIRCGFMIPTAVKQAWAAEIEVLQEIDRICRKHNISYFADWGTFLGTIRHGGFVPWDDDLDIVMKRDDLIRFLEVAPKEFCEGFHIQDFRNQPDYWLFMKKVVGRNHMCFESEHLRKFHNFPYMACVDIFVLDYAHTDPGKEEKRRTSCKYTMGVADAIIEGRMTDEADIREHISRIEEIGDYKPGSLKIYGDPVEMGRYLYGLIEERFMEVPREEATHLVQLFPQGLRNSDRHYPIEFFDDPIEMPFEYATIPVPRYYDYLLHKKYGEYGHFNKGGGAHDYPYFEGQKRNLLKVLDFDFPEFRATDNIIAKVRNRMNGTEGPDIGGHKALIVEALGEIGNLSSDINNIPDAQQLAVDLGSMIESLYVESAKPVQAVEKFCEEAYLLYKQALNGQASDAGEFVEAYDEMIDIISTEILDKKIAVFMPFGTNTWDNFAPLWDEYIESGEWNLLVIPVPYYYKDYDNSPTKTINEYDWWAQHFGDIIVNPVNISSEYLAMLRPDIIFIQDVYDEWNPNISVYPDYYSSRLIEYTNELVYIPRLCPDDFGDRNSREYHNMKYYVLMPGVVYADHTYVNSDRMRQMYIEALSDFAGENTRDIWEKKICVSPGICVSKKKNNDAEKKILYGIGLGPLYEHRNAIENKIKNVTHSLNLERGEENLTVYVCLYPAEPKRINELLPQNTLKSLLNNAKVDIHLIDHKDVNPDDFDGYYGDVIPVMSEFISRGKPVMLQNWLV